MLPWHRDKLLARRETSSDIASYAETGRTGWDIGVDARTSCHLAFKCLPRGLRDRRRRRRDGDWSKETGFDCRRPDIVRLGAIPVFYYTKFTSSSAGTSCYFYLKISFFST